MSSLGARAALLASLLAPRALAAEAPPASDLELSALAAAEADAAPPDGEQDRWRGPLGPTALFTGSEPLSQASALTLALSAGVARSPGERERVFGLVELRLGLDDWLGARGPGAEPDGAALDGPGGDGAARPPLATGAPLDATLPAAPSFQGVAAGAPPLASGASAAAALAPAPRPRGARPERMLGREAAVARLARRVVTEALRVQGGPAERRRLDGMAARSRAAASLPEVRLGAGTSRDESLRLSPTLADPARFTRDGGRDLWLEARLTWRLDSAIFARDEIAIMRLRAQQREESARLMRDALEALVEWQRARLALVDPLASPEARDAASVRQFGALARLDVLTDGWFSRYLERWGGGAAERWP